MRNQNRKHFAAWIMTFGLIASAAVMPPHRAVADEWGCYDPQPGHPTEAEKAAFVAEVREFAREAERTYGPPACALIAMACAESGYGWTRTALNANNLFGFKFNSQLADGRGSWELECQPADDPGKLYVAFADRRDAILYVGRMLSTLQRYKGATAAYRSDLASGVKLETAVDKWVSGIADAGYNWNPAQYKATLTHFMNDYMAPSMTRSAAHNLYQYSPNATEVSGGAGAGTAEVTAGADAEHPSESGAPLPTEDVARVEAQFTAKNARYMERNCQDTTYPDWDGYPLRRCNYTVKDSKTKTTKSATVIMLNAGPNQLARWVVRTCQEIKRSTDRACTDRLFNQIQSQSGAQFPVAGIVFEDMNGTGVNEAYVFRHGVTVRIDELRNGSTEQPTPAQIEASLNGDVMSVGKYARIQGTTVDDYRTNGGAEDVGTFGKQKPAWLKVVRELYQKAWGQDHNELMIAWAKSNL